MEGRSHRGRGGGWRRGGGSGGNDSESSGGEHRGRGRGGHHRGRGKRDHYRGRGRGGAAPPARFNRDQDGEAGIDQEEEEGMEIFSRRKLESNWDRYKESEKEEPIDDMPTQRGTDYHVLLESAGDSFTQFRFSEEKEWELDSLAANQMSSVFVDLPALAQSLQELPLYLRLNLEAELVQVSTPVELPTMTLPPKVDLGKATFKPTATVLKGPIATLGVSLATSSISGTAPQGSSSVAKPPEDDVDQELDQLLSLQRPVSEASEKQTATVMHEEVAVSEKLPIETKEAEPDVKMQDKDVSSPSKAAPVRQEVTEEDLEDWLDSMIS